MPGPALPPPTGWRLAGAALVAASLAVLAILAVANGTFYDDEIFTLNLLRDCPGPAALIACANGADVHPPLGYLLDEAVHAALGSWAAVKLAKGLLMALAAGWLAWRAGRVLPATAFALLVALLALDGTLVMWSASLRWYGWFVPLYTLCLAQVLWGRQGPLASLAWLVLGGVMLFHINYLAVIAVPLLGLAWALRHGPGLSARQLRLGMVIVAAGLALCLPQAVVMIGVHLQYHGPQSGPLAMSLVQTGLTVFPGNALAPLTPLALAALTVVALATGLVLWRRTPLPPALVAILVLGMAAMIATGLGYRHRNNLFLHLTAVPLVALVLAALPPRLRVVAAAVVLAASAQGAINVVRHEGTIKRSYNTPYPAVIATIDGWSRRCPGRVVTDSDIVLGELLRGRPERAGLDGSGTVMLQPGQCLIVETGSAADWWPEAQADWRARLAALPARELAVARFRPEPEAARAARLMGKPMESHAATLRLLRLTAPAAVPEFGLIDPSRKLPAR